MRVEGLAECVRKKLGRVSGLHSLILYGSLLRGDFVPGTSDVDFFAVLGDGTDPEIIIEKIKPVLEECSAFLNPVEVDVAWEWLSNLRDPLNLGYPYKFLTVYQRDFRENHVVLLGEDVVGIIPEYSLDELLPGRLEGILRNLERFSRNLKMLHILAGETARLMAFLSGSSLRKDDVLRTLQQLGDNEAVMIYTAYLKGRNEPFDGDFLQEFVKLRVEKMKTLFLPPHKQRH
ncbi:nucleotidyltransferase domain-containing protein [Thermococcus sp. MAR1]|uniref:nucleotidyltransferase domain-containing protein n=1 Tax=Thermococcus sp. MAR1 TaxID=1638263 RepID=UPI001438D676|nr:nucleotidyltransferase domain-containing protein [Thermococcus sp. MAR1]NJE09364.1 nucleotidyltransferase domain-containing protein [Thermococcus sp. MAR1]